MKSSPNEAFESLSAFGKAALSLDGDLVLFERLVGDLDRLSVDGEKGLEKGLKLLEEIAVCRARLESGMQALSKTLTEARESNERAEKIVIEKGLQVQAKQKDAEQMFARFKTLGDVVQQLNTSMNQIREQAADGISEEDRAHLTTRFPEFNSQLDLLVTEAKRLVDDAHQAGMKILERNADSLRQSLTSARNRINLLIERQAKPEDLH